MSDPVTFAAVAAPFDRDLQACFDRIATIIDQARAAGAQVVALPEAALGGYVADLRLGEAVEPPPALLPDGPEIRRLAELAGDLVVCAGYCEDAGEVRYNAATCVHDGRIVANYRKVHQPLAEGEVYKRGDALEAFDTPYGRMGLLICWDKGFAEAARTLALDGADIICCLSAWPASRTERAARIEDDRWSVRFNLFDRARALDNQIVWLASNQTGSFGTLDFVGQAKVVGPGGDVLATTGVGEGLAVATVDVDAELTAHRRGMCNLRDRRPDVYRLGEWKESA